MNTNHAKAIKGMSIANIVLAALGLLGVLAIWAMLGAGGAAIDGSGYDYFYTDDGYYIEASDVTAILGMLGGLVGFLFVGCVLVLVAGIIGVRGAAAPEKLKGVMVWNIVGAVAALITGSWISLVLCIIVAVFANKDKKLYGAPAAPAYAPYGAAPVAPAAAPQQPYTAPAPVTPTVPVAAEAVTATEAVACDTGAAPVPVAVEETVAEGTFAPAETAAEAQAAAEAPAVVLPDNNVEEVADSVTVVEVPADEDKPNA